MDISIIIPLYNKEEYIEDCLNSCLSQVFQGEFEVIVVDDGSIDNSGKIADRIAAKDNRLKIIHTQNGGVTAARRIGYEHAQGKFVMFVDSDDKLLDNALSSTYDAIIQQNADEVVAYYKTQHGRIADSGIRGWANPDFMIKELLASRIYFCVLWGILFRKEILKGCLDIPRDIRNGEDILLQIKVLAKKPKVYFIGKCIYYYMEGLPNDRRLELEVEKLYDQILEDTLSEKGDKYKSSILHHKVKVYENFINERKFYAFRDYYKQFRKHMNKDIPLLDKIVMALPPRLAYFPVHYYKKWTGRC